MRFAIVAVLFSLISGGCAARAAHQPPLPQLDEAEEKSERELDLAWQRIEQLEAENGQLNEQLNVARQLPNVRAGGSYATNGSDAVRSDTEVNENYSLVGFGSAIRVATTSAQPGDSSSSEESGEYSRLPQAGGVSLSREVPVVVVESEGINTGGNCVGMVVDWDRRDPTTVYQGQFVRGKEEEEGAGAPVDCRGGNVYQHSFRERASFSCGNSTRGYYPCRR